MSTLKYFRSLAALSEPTRKAFQTLEMEWKPDSPPNTIAMGTVARALAAGVKTTSRDQIRAVLEFAEQLLTNADQTTRDAVATGFLESLLSEASAGRFDFSSIDSLLGNESRKYCNAWDTFSGVVTKGLSQSSISHGEHR
jgi:hypothetical protein